MKVEITGNNQILIVPETDFETMWLNQNFNVNYGNKITAFIKTGLTINDVLGLKIVSKRD